jgi:hypothetical protein
VNFEYAERIFTPAPHHHCLNFQIFHNFLTLFSRPAAPPLTQKSRRGFYAPLNNAAPEETSKHERKPFKPKFYGVKKCTSRATYLYAIDE